MYKSRWLNSCKMRHHGDKNYINIHPHCAHHRRVNIHLLVSACPFFVASYKWSCKYLFVSTDCRVPFLLGVQVPSACKACLHKAWLPCMHVLQAKVLPQLAVGVLCHQPVLAGLLLQLHWQPVPGLESPLCGWQHASWRPLEGEEDCFLLVLFPRPAWLNWGCNASVKLFQTSWAPAKQKPSSETYCCQIYSKEILLCAIYLQSHGLCSILCVYWHTCAATLAVDLVRFQAEQSIGTGDISLCESSVQKVILGFKSLSIWHLSYPWLWTCRLGTPNLGRWFQWQQLVD